MISSDNPILLTGDYNMPGKWDVKTQALSSSEKPFNFMQTFQYYADMR